LAGYSIRGAILTRSPLDCHEITADGVTGQDNPGSPINVPREGNGWIYSQHNGPRFDAAAAGSGIALLRTPIRAPRAYAICERLIGSLRRECVLSGVLVTPAVQ
jgi:transposase InsO family protein